MRSQISQSAVYPTVPVGKETGWSRSFSGRDDRAIPTYTSRPVVDIIGLIFVKLCTDIMELNLDPLNDL